jgi:chorismate mutase
MKTRQILLAAALSFFGSQLVYSQTELSPVDKELATLMRQRLDFAPRIAWIKYKSDQPLSDNAREVVLLKNLEEAGQKLGLNPQRVRDFFSAQMAAFQTVQKEEIESWKAGEPVPTFTPMDLQTEIRPAIEKLNGDLIALLAKPDVDHSAVLAKYCEGILRDGGFSEAAAKQATAPLVSELPWKAP